MVILCSCGFNACWVCGLKAYNSFHLAQFGIGILCEYTNRLYHNSLKINYHLIPMSFQSRFLVFVISVFFYPILIFIFFLFYYMEYVTDLLPINKLK